jgi:hypothetical protein
MKNQIKLIAALFMLIAFTSCHRGRHVIISTESNNVSIKIEYFGTIVVNNDKTQIEAISHDGYVNYNRNGDQLYAATDNSGHIVYELNGNQTTTLDNNGRELLAEAVKIIAKEQYHH